MMINEQGFFATWNNSHSQSSSYEFDHHTVSIVLLFDYDDDQLSGLPSAIHSLPLHDGQR